MFTLRSYDGHSVCSWSTDEGVPDLVTTLSNKTTACPFYLGVKGLGLVALRPGVEGEDLRRHIVDTMAGFDRE